MYLDLQHFLKPEEHPMTNRRTVTVNSETSGIALMAVGSPMELGVELDREHYDGQPQLYAVQTDDAICHPLDLSGELSQAWEILQALEHAMKQHRLMDGDSEFTNLQRQAYETVRSSQRMLAYLYDQQFELWDN